MLLEQFFLQVVEDFKNDSIIELLILIFVITHNYMNNFFYELSFELLCSILKESLFLHFILAYTRT